MLLYIVKMGGCLLYTVLLVCIYPAVVRHWIKMMAIKKYEQGLVSNSSLEKTLKSYMFTFIPQTDTHNQAFLTIL